MKLAKSVKYVLKLEIDLNLIRANLVQIHDLKT